MQAVTINVQTSITTESLPPSNEVNGIINEMILSGPLWQTGHFLKPMLNELANEQKACWLTLILSREEAAATIKWLKSSGINSHRVQVLNATNQETAKLTCQALESGTSHTVVSWVDKMDAFTLKQLESAARNGKCQGLTIQYFRHF